MTLLNYYNILEIEIYSEIDSSVFYQKFKKFHPEITKDKEFFIHLNEAYAIVSNPELKNIYDKFLGLEINGQEIEINAENTNDLEKLQKAIDERKKRTINLIKDSDDVGFWGYMIDFVINGF